MTTVVPRLSLDKLRSVPHRREVYPGEWLPEPVFGAPNPEQDAITRSRLSVGLLYLLDKLEPEQRIVLSSGKSLNTLITLSIAEIVGESEAACRQLEAHNESFLPQASRNDKKQ